MCVGGGRILNVAGASNGGAVGGQYLNCSKAPGEQVRKLSSIYITLLVSKTLLRHYAPLAHFQSPWNSVNGSFELNGEIGSIFHRLHRLLVERSHVWNIGLHFKAFYGILHK